MFVEILLTLDLAVSFTVVVGESITTSASMGVLLDITLSVGIVDVSVVETTQLSIAGDTVFVWSLLDWSIVVTGLSIECPEVAATEGSAPGGVIEPFSLSIG